MKNGEQKTELQQLQTALNSDSAQSPEEILQQGEKDQKAATGLTYDEEKKVFTLIEDGGEQETAEEKAKQLEADNIAAIKAKKPEDRTSEETAVLEADKKARVDADVATVNATLAELVKKNPELAEALGGTDIGKLLKKDDAEEANTTKKLSQAPVFVLDDTQLGSLDEVTAGMVQAESIKRLEARGMKVPRTQEEWDKLWDEKPGRADAVRRALDREESNLERTILRVTAANRKAPEFNNQVAQYEFQSVQAEAKKAGIDVKEEDFIAFAGKLVTAGDPSVVQMLHGVRVLKPGGLLAAWVRDNYVKIVEGIAQRSVVAGRQQAIDAKAGQGKPVVVAAAAGGQARKKRETTIDPTSENDLAKINDVKTLERMFDQPTK